MRVLIVHTQLWAHYKSVLFQEIFRELRRRDPGAELLVAQIALHEQSRAAMADSADEIGYDYPYKVLFSRDLDSVTLAERIRALFALFRSFRPNVLNITGYFDPAQVALAFYAKAVGVKVVISVESSQTDHRRSGWKERLKKLILDCSDDYFCFGHTSVEYLKALGIPEQKITVKKAAVVDNQRIAAVYADAKSGETFREAPGIGFVYVGRLATEKNLLLLLEAYGLLPDTSRTLLLVGEGPMRAQLEAYVGEHDLPGVTFAGGVAWYRVPALLAQADVLILPSLSEPWGLVVNEAMTCGMPVIVSERCGCTGDLVQNGVNGFTFDPESVDSLTEAMRYYLQNPDAVTRHGAASLRLIAPFAPAAAAAQMVAGFKRLGK